MSESKLPGQSKVVIVGGGVMGAGLAYHLAEEGWTDCVLIEKAELTSGATWHAAGLVSRMTGAQTMGKINDYAKLSRVLTTSASDKICADESARHGRLDRYHVRERLWLSCDGTGS